MTIETLTQDLQEYVNDNTLKEYNHITLEQHKEELSGALDAYLDLNRKYMTLKDENEQLLNKIKELESK